MQQNDSLADGLLTPGHERYLHYVFVEAEHDPENAPVVMWSNGGESRLTAAIPMDNPYCSCELTRRCRAGLLQPRRLHDGDGAPGVATVFR